MVSIYVLAARLPHANSAYRAVSVITQRHSRETLSATAASTFSPNLVDVEHPSEYGTPLIIRTGLILIPSFYYLPPWFLGSQLYCTITVTYACTSPNILCLSEARFRRLVCM